MSNLTSEDLLTIRIIRQAAYQLGCILNTPKIKNQAMILNFVSNANLTGLRPNARCINGHLGFSLAHTRKLIATAVSEGKLVAYRGNSHNVRTYTVGASNT